MIQVNIKALSVNEAWQGRRFKTAKYKKYCEDLPKLLPKDAKIPKEGDLVAYFIFRVSSTASDLDNLLKPTIDILQKKYKFNDRRISRIEARKKLTEKGKEAFFFAFTKDEE